MIKIKKHKNKLLRLMINIETGIIWLLLYTIICFLLIIIIDKCNGSLGFSPNTYLKLHNTGDWLILFLMIISFSVGLIFVKKTYEYAKLPYAKYNFRPFIQGCLGILLVTWSLLSLTTALTLAPQKYNAKSVAQIIHMTNLSFVIHYVVIFIAVILTMLLVHKWLKQNNWYWLGTMLLPMIYIRDLVSSQVRLNRFLNEGSKNYIELAKILNVTNKEHIVDLSQINMAGVSAIQFAVIGMIIVLMIGVIAFGIKIRKKQIKRITKETKEK